MDISSNYIASGDQVCKSSKSNTRHVMKNYVHISDRYMPPRAVAVLPAVLQIRRNFISPRRPLPRRVCFGPVQGITKTISSLDAKELIKQSVVSKVPLFLLQAEKNFVTYIDITDHDKSNWLCLLPLGDETTANVWLYEKDNNLYAVTTKPISRRVPLMIGYSSDYVKMHGFPPESPCLDINDELSIQPSEWWCFECHRALPSAALLQHHMDVEHKSDKIIPRRLYRCCRCKRKFTRLFTLKRHITRYCTNKDEQEAVSTQNTTQISTNVESEIDTNYLLEESRVPSEEILQNLTASIDFNSLFDTYRMSSLDLSGSSKSSVDLIDPDNQLSKDSDNLTDPFNSINTEGDHLLKNPTAVVEEPVAVLNNTPVVCNKKGKPEKTQEQVSDQPKEFFSCECGRVFLNKDRLIRHASEHSESTKLETSDIMYKCEDCQLIFKRRGMFVNHLHRVHNNVTTNVPLERRVRQYPCVACDKLYRTAAKRNRHVSKYHPGVECGGARAVDRGRRTCAAAACVACPRQYATRAKLMQHMRAAHPHIASPVKMSTPKESK